MKNLTKFNYLARKLLEKHRRGRHTANLERWRTLIKKIAHDYYIQLGYLHAFETSEIVARLRNKKEKLRKMDVYKRWNKNMLI